MDRKKYTGIAVTLAWPKTYCRQAGGWYDGILKFLGICHHHYYRVGHSALLLIDKSGGKCHYYDFGRYQAPCGFGRVRSEETDPGLRVKTPPRFSEDGLTIANLSDILKELQMNVECHGEGPGFAAECPVNFQKARAKGMQMQRQSPIPYGPFVRNGTNCSRFVNAVVKAGNPPLSNLLRLKYFIWFTPTPMNNIHALNNKIRLPHLRGDRLFCPKPLKDKSFLQFTLPEPDRPDHIPAHAQWLSGEGAGSWYALDQLGENRFQLRRFGPGGEPEGKALMECSGEKAPDIGCPYQIIHLSNCRQVRVFQNGDRYTLRSIEKPETFSLEDHSNPKKSKITADAG